MPFHRSSLLYTGPRFKTSGETHSDEMTEFNLLDILCSGVEATLLT